MKNRQHHPARPRRRWSTLPPTAMATWSSAAPIPPPARRRGSTARSGAGRRGSASCSTPDRVEAYAAPACPERFGFDADTTGLSAKPTLSVLTRTDKPIEAVVQLLSSRVELGGGTPADMSATGKKFDLGGLAHAGERQWHKLRQCPCPGRRRQAQPLDGLHRAHQPRPAHPGPLLAAGLHQRQPRAVLIERAFPLGFDTYSYDSRAAIAMPVPAPPPPPPPPPPPKP